MRIQRHGRHGTVCDRHLPRPYHLISCDHAGDAPVTNRNEETLRRHRWEGQYPFQGFSERHCACIKLIGHRWAAARLPVHLGWFAKQHRHGDIHRGIVELAICHQQVLCLSGLAHHRVRTSLSLADGLKSAQFLWLDRQHVALLRFVTPDFQGRHSGFVIRHSAQVKTSTPAAVLHQLRQGIAQPAGTHVMDESDRIVLAEAPAPVNNLLAAPLYLGVLSLHGGKIEIFGAVATGHGRGCATAQANQHGRPTQYDQFCAR